MYVESEYICIYYTVWNQSLKRTLDQDLAELQILLPSGERAPKYLMQFTERAVNYTVSTIASELLSNL